MEEINLEVSSLALDGVKLLNNVISEEISRKLIVNAVKQLLINGPALPARADIYETSVKCEVKQADFGVCSLLLAAAQHDIEPYKFKDFLEGKLKINSKTSAQLSESYEKFKDEFTVRLEKCGNSHNFPAITDVDYEIQQEASGELIFKITLKGTSDKTLFCNQEELQLLTTKLKGIERHCERLSKVDN